MVGIRDHAPRRALRTRRVQALALLLLATALTAVAAAAPLYTRAMAQSLTDADITQAPLVTTSLDVVARRTNSIEGLDGKPDPPRTLDELVPHDVRRHYRAPLLGWSALADNYAFALTGQVVWREGQCDHVVWVQGTCPQKADEIAVSEADLKLPRVAVGSRIEVPGITQVTGQPATVPLHVVAVYRPEPGTFWATRPPTGRSGEPTESGTQHDDWLSTEATFDSGSAPPLNQLVSEVVYQLDPARTDVDDLAALPASIERARAQILQASPGTGIELQTSVADLAGDVAHQRRQAEKTVPMLMAQVLLLGLLVAWQLLGAATNQRRGEAALALLRGRGRRGAAGLLARELLPPVLAGVPLGGVLALALGWWGRHQVLPYTPKLELVTGFWVALVGATAVLTALTAAAVSLVAREPVAQLLRSVSRSRGVGIWPAVALAVSGTGAFAFVAGWLGGSGALAGPALLAVVVGLVLSYAVAPLTARAGRVALRHGLVRTALAVTDAARSPGARRLVAMTTVATAILVFSADAVAVGDRNRQRAAEQDVGAAQVISVTGDLGAVRAAVAQVDPHGTRATVVAVKQPPGVLGAIATVGVEPEEFRRIALLDARQRGLPWSRLTPSTTAPLRLAGRTARLQVAGDLAGRAPLTLQLTLAVTDGTVRTTTLGVVRRHGGTLLRGPVPCDDGCTLTSVVLQSRPGVEISGTVTLGAFTVDGKPVAWGAPSQWRSVAGNDGVLRASAAAGGLALQLDNQGANQVALSSAWLPATYPALVSGHAPTGTVGGRFDLVGLDGTDRPAEQVALTERLPGVPLPSAVTDLDTLSRSAGSVADLTEQVWTNQTSSAFTSRLREALREHGAGVVSVSSVERARATYDRSVAAWSLALAVVVGITGLLAALLALVVVAVTSWQVRSHDVAALRMAGLPLVRLRQAAVAAQVGAVVIAVAAGAVTGLVGAQLALGDVPILAHAPVGWSLDLNVAWAAVVLAAAGALVVLAVAGWISARLLTTRARLDRLRGMS
ncbi:MAG: FtsX-like permease family protein [Marmoricola sp.]